MKCKTNTWYAGEIAFELSGVYFNSVIFKNFFARLRMHGTTRLLYPLAPASRKSSTLINDTIKIKQGLRSSGISIYQLTLMFCFVGGKQLQKYYTAFSSRG